MTDLQEYVTEYDATSSGEPLRALSEIQELFKLEEFKNHEIIPIQMNSETEYLNKPRVRTHVAKHGFHIRKVRNSDIILIEKVEVTKSKVKK